MRVTNEPEEAALKRANATWFPVVVVVVGKNGGDSQIMLVVMFLSWNTALKIIDSSVRDITLFLTE